MIYFAYGSNMLKERLKLRVPGVRCLGVAHVLGRRLAFHKCSSDGSGKCDIPMTGINSDIVYGVLYDVPDCERPALDEVEGVGSGYEAAQIMVRAFGSSQVEATVYLASTDSIDESLAPYDWYHCLVVAGARQHHLPDDYISLIVSVRPVLDSKSSRKTRCEALRALKEANVEYPGNP